MRNSTLSMPPNISLSDIPLLNLMVPNYQKVQVDNCTKMKYRRLFTAITNALRAVPATIHSTNVLIGHFLPLYFCTKNNRYPYPTCYMVFVPHILNISTLNYTNAFRFRDFKPNLQKSSFLSQKIL